MTDATVKLKSLDGKIFIVDPDVIKQMGTIQTMLDSLGVDDDETNTDEIVPIYTVNGEILDKVIEWTKFHTENNDKSGGKVWSNQFFKTNMEKMFQLMEAADYLEINSLLTDGQVFIDKYFEDIIATEAFKDLSEEKLSLLLARDTLNVPNEEAVFESVVSWSSADSGERSKCLANLLPYIRARFLTCQFLDGNVKTFLEKRNSLELCHLLDKGNRTPRQGFEQCIVALHRMDHGRCLKYLDTKVWRISVDSENRFYWKKTLYFRLRPGPI